LICGVRAATTNSCFALAINRKRPLFRSVRSPSDVARRVAITTDGKFLASEEMIPLSDFPEAARRTVTTEAAGVFRFEM